MPVAGISLEKLLLDGEVEHAPQDIEHAVRHCGGSPRLNCVQSHSDLTPFDGAHPATMPIHLVHQNAGGGVDCGGPIVLPAVLEVPLDHGLPKFPLGIPPSRHWVDVSGDLTEQLPRPFAGLLLADDRASAERYLHLALIQGAPVADGPTFDARLLDDPVEAVPDCNVSAHAAPLE